MAGETRLYEQFEPEERMTLTLEALARNDEPEADRLTSTCPRKQYEMRDAAFADRMDVGFNIMVVACADLRYLSGKVEMLEFALFAARHMATRHQLAATFAFMDGERYANQRPQMDFFGKQSEEPDDPDEDVADEPNDPPENEPLTAPVPLRASKYREGELARRMMAVEDRMQVTTDETFAAILHVLDAKAKDLAEVWTAYDRFCRDRLGVSAETMLAAWDVPIGGDVTKMLKKYGHVQPDPAKVEEYHGIYCRAWDRRFDEDEDE